MSNTQNNTDSVEKNENKLCESNFNISNMESQSDMHYVMISDNNPKYLLKIKLLNDNMRHHYDNHGPSYHDDSGIDIYVSEDVVVKPRSFGTVIKTDICAELINIENGRTIPYMIVGRSSIYRIPIRISQAISIIDAGFRGSIHIIVDNYSDNAFCVRRGARLAQIIAPDLGLIKVEIVSELSDGSRDNCSRDNRGINPSTLLLASKSNIGIIEKSKL